MARKKMFVDPSRAVTELNLPQTPPRVALEKAVRWFRDHGYA
jgi:dihydroflavonol-4-reductase